MFTVCPEELDFEEEPGFIFAIDVSRVAKAHIISIDFTGVVVSHIHEILYLIFTSKSIYP